MDSLLTLLQPGKGLDETQAAQLTQNLSASLLDIMAVARLVASRGESRPFTCGIVNAKSGRCQENCSFCAQSSHHRTDAPVYPLLSMDEMLAHAERYAEAEVDYCGLVMSGAKPTPEEFDRMCETATRVKSRIPIKLCASLGLLDTEQARRLKQAGFTSYHHNLETAPSFYPEVCPSHDFAQRAQTVRNAKSAGLRACCGGLYGMGESWEHRLDLSRTLAELDVDSIPVNFLNAVPGTPLENMPSLPAGEALGVIAIMRLMHPNRDIVICGGRGHALGRFENLIFSAGANGLMVGNYLTTKGGPLDSDREMVRVLGMNRHG